MGNETLDLTPEEQLERRQRRWPDFDEERREAAEYKAKQDAIIADRMKSLDYCTCPHRRIVFNQFDVARWTELGRPIHGEGLGMAVCLRDGCDTSRAGCSHRNYQDGGGDSAEFVRNGKGPETDYEVTDKRIQIGKERVCHVRDYYSPSADPD